MSTGFKAKLYDGAQVESPATVTYTVFDGVSELTMPSAERDSHDITPLDQTDNYKRKYPDPIIDGGVMTVHFYYTPTNFGRILSLMESGETREWKTEDPAAVGSTRKATTFQGYVKKLNNRLYKKGEYQMFSCDVELTGPWTVTTIV